MSMIQKTIEAIPVPDAAIFAAAQERLRHQVRPAGSLGRLESASARLAAIAGTPDVRLTRRTIVICAGDHGVCAEGVSLFPAKVTAQMVYAFVANAASINVLARHVGASVLVADLGVDCDFAPTLPIIHRKIRHGTANFAHGPAMTRAEAEAAISAGIAIVDELVAKGQRPDILGTGDMGIGNTTPSSAIIAVFSGLPPESVVGRGTGVDDEGVRRKCTAIKAGLRVNRPDPADPLGVLAGVGGLEIGGLAGLIIGGARHRIPVVCDGLISTAGAVLACALAPQAAAYLFAAHQSVEPGHRHMLAHLGLQPLLDLEMRLGEGTGAALAMQLLDAATRILHDIKTFDEVKIEDVQQH